MGKVAAEADFQEIKTEVQSIEFDQFGQLYPPSAPNLFCRGFSLDRT